MALAHVAVRCSQLVPPHRPTRQRRAAGAGGRPPACRQPPKPGCTRCLPVPGGSAPSHASGTAACCCAQPHPLVVSGQVGEVMGFSPLEPQLCCYQTSLTFPWRLPVLAGGMRALLIAALPSQQLTLLHSYFS